MPTRARMDFQAFGRGERSDVAGFAREDNALSCRATDTSRMRDGRAVFAFASRSAATARLEGGGSVQALVSAGSTSEIETLVGGGVEGAEAARASNWAGCFSSGAETECGTSTLLARLARCREDA